MQIEFVIKADDQASGPLQNVNTALSGIGDISGGVETAFGKVAGGLANIAQYAIGNLLSDAINGIANAVRGLASDMIGSLASFEQYEVQFGVLLGSSEAAKQRMQELAEFGIKTPFELPQVVEADRVLQNFGFHAEDAAERFGFSGEEVLEIAGDVASGTGASFTDISNLLGRFSSGAVGEAIMRMQELGITTKTQLTEMGLSFDKAGSLVLGNGEAIAGWSEDALKAQEALPKLSQDLELARMRFDEMSASGTASASSMLAQQYRVEDLEAQIAQANDTIKNGWVESQGAPTLDQATSLLLDIMKDKYGGMMEEQSKTFTGMLSNLTDWKDATLRKIGEPIFEVLKDKLGGLLEYLSGPDAQAAIDTFVAGLASFVASDVVPFLEGLIAQIPNVISWLSQLGQNIQTAFASPDVQNIITAVLGFGSALQELMVQAQPVIDQIVTFIADNVSLGDVLTGLGIVIAATVIPALISAAVAAAPVVAAVVGVIAAVALLRAAWENDFLGIRTALTEFWENTAQPALSQLVEWLQVNIPIAVEQLSTFWNTKLLPALRDFWNFLNTYVFPAISLLVNTHFANVQKSAGDMSNFWNNTLLPTFKKVSDFMNTYVFPVFSAIGNLIGSVVNVAFKALAGLWENVLYPAFLKVSSTVKSELNPVFERLAQIARDVLGPPLKWLYDIIVRPLIEGFKILVGLLPDIASQINNLANNINNMSLPDWLTPGSPTPFELGLRGINDAMMQIGGLGMPALAGSLPAGGSAAMGMGGNRVTIGQIVFNGQSAPANPEQAQQSVSLFVDALRARGVDVGGAS